MNTEISFRLLVLCVFIIWLAMIPATIYAKQMETRIKAHEVEIYNLIEHIISIEGKYTDLQEQVRRMKKIQEFHLENTEPHMKGL